MQPDFRIVFEASPNAYMLLDRELRYVEANAAYLELVAATRDTLLGRCIFDLFPHDPGDSNNTSARLLRASLEQVLRTREPDVIPYIPYRVAKVPGGAL